MMRAHQPGSRPLDIPEAIPNPAVPQPVPNPSPPPREPVKVPVPQNAVGYAASDLAAGYWLFRVRRYAHTTLKGRF
jgi:hypothetical protein